MANITIATPLANLEFPADTSPDEIRAAIGEYAKTPEARASALNQWADQYVKNERAGGGVMQAVGDTVRQLGIGTVGGSWLGEANALTASALQGVPYDEAIAYQNATDRAVDQSTGAVGTGLKVAGGVGSFMLSPLLRVMQGSAMLPTAVNLGATGGLYGGIYGAGEGEGLAQRAGNAVQGVGIGATVGAVAAPVAKGLSNAVGYAADKFKGVPDDLKPYVRGAIDRVSRATADDIPNPADMPGLAKQYGAQGMLADLGPNLQAQVGAVARTPGEGKTIALGALNRRAEGAGDRITSELNRSLGPEINMPRAIDAIDKQASAAAKPFYDQFRKSPIPYTRELEDIVGTLKNEPSVLRDARRLANIDSASGPKQFFAKVADDGAVTIERVPNAAEWDYVKRALDGLAYSNSATKNDKRIYGGLSSKIRDTVDSILSPADPSKSPWALGRAASGEGKGLTEALDSGRSAFGRGISPDELSAEISGLSAPEKLAYTLGGRQNVRDVMGNASTKWGANDDTAARKLLGSDYARQKLEILAGRDNANRLTGRLDTETAFDSTLNAAKGNSVTAAATAAQKEFPNAVDKTAVSREIGAQSLTGIGLRGIKAMADALMGGAISERRAAIARDAARMLTAEAGPRDNIAKALMDYRNSQGMTDNAKAAVDRLLRALVPSSRQAIIDESTR